MKKFERYFGFHFTETGIYIAEAYVDRYDHLNWDVVEQANYGLEPEWLPLFKDAIPNLYDTVEREYGFAALPNIKDGLHSTRFLWFNSHFFEKAGDGTMTARDRDRLAHLLGHCQVYHIRPRRDETLVVTLVTEGLISRQRDALLTLLEQIAPDTGLEFVDVIEPKEACLRYLWYEDVRQNLDVENKMILLIHLGYTLTLMVPWNHCQLINRTVKAPGMLEIDRSVAGYVRQMMGDKTIGMNELLLYAQRARSAFKSSQPSVKVADFELERPAYQDIIKRQVYDITDRLERLLCDPDGVRVDEIVLSGEGASFQPVIEAIGELSCVDVPMHVLPQPTYAAAKGAASKSWLVKNPDAEVR